MVDWIAHGILDSIVDSFFPYLEEIEKEVVAIEDLVFAPKPIYEFVGSSSATNVGKGEKPKHTLPVAETFSLNEKSPSVGGSIRPRFAAPRWTFPLIFRRIRRTFTKRWRRIATPSEAPPSATTLTLRQMARARRLVTSLSRLLASKSEVVTQIRKRLLKTGTSGLGNGTKVEELEVAIYMGDVQGMFRK